MWIPPEVDVSLMLYGIVNSLIVNHNHWVPSMVPVKQAHNDAKGLCVAACDYKRLSCTTI